MSVNADAAAVLRAAADLIMQPGAWCRGAFARDAAGLSVTSTDPQARSWCAAGAITASLYRSGARPLEPTDVHAATHRAVDVVLGSVGMYGFNDLQESPEPVAAALRAAADRLDREKGP